MQPPLPAHAANLDDVEASEVERLIEERNAARKAGNFARADAISDRLTEMGVALEDAPGGTIWRKS